MLRLDARDKGSAGEFIRAIVDYNTLQPEATFNLELFRWQIDSAGKRQKSEIESWKNLSMIAGSPLYVVDFLNGNSKLVNAALPGALPAATAAFSLSGRPVNVSGGFQPAWQARLGSTQTGANQFQISVGGSPYAEVDLQSVVVAATAPATATLIQGVIEAKFTALEHSRTQVDFVNGPIANTQQLRIARRNPPAGANTDVYIRPASSRDSAVPLMLGTGQGGIEVSMSSRWRPAPCGITFDISELTAAPEVSTQFNALGAVLQNQWTGITLNTVTDAGVPATVTIQIVTLRPLTQW